MACSSACGVNLPLSPSTSVMTAPDSWAGPPASAISVWVSRR